MAFDGVALLGAGVLGYLLGSVPFGLLLTRAAGLGDIRQIGSGNIGATNVLRTGRKGLAVATLLLDALKGTAAVFAGGALANLLGGDGGAAAGLAAGLAAFVGHCFPIWLGFRGGKGVATFIGVLLGWSWPIALAFCVTWLGVAALTRYSSLSALVASAVAPLLLILWNPLDRASDGPWATGLAAAAMAALLIWRHRENIQRLRAGTESRIGQKA